MLKVVYSSYLRAMEHHLPYGTTHTHTGERGPLPVVEQYRAVLKLPTQAGWEAELTLVLVINRDVRRESPIQVVSNHPLDSDQTPSGTGDLLIVSPAS